MKDGVDEIASVMNLILPEDNQIFPTGEEFVNETFSLFLESMNLKESELIGIDNLGSLLDLVKERNQND